MDNRARFKNVMMFQKADRLPMVEWATWWDKTISRWKNEGLPERYSDEVDIRQYMGLDMYKQFWINIKKPSCPEPKSHGAPLIWTIQGYERLKKHLFPENPIDEQTVRLWAEKQSKGEAVIWITLNGFFWWPRTLLGIEEHLYAFYDNPELMHAINRDLVEYNMYVFNKFCSICVPDFMSFAEDMSYNNGPMISEMLFNEFMAPYYKNIVPLIKSKGTEIFIDSDGNIESMVPWFEKVGVNGFLPLERQAGVDIVRLRRNHPHIKVIGGFDKMVMDKGEEALRKEFERIMPVMRQGGYIPSVDHQTPPSVSMEQYRVYLRLLKEYCGKAVE